MNGIIIPRPEHGGADPDGINDFRLERGRAVLDFYEDALNWGCGEEGFRDLISDVLHAGHARGLDLADELRIATQNFNGETAS